jgi:hypothetical protein
MSPLLANPVSRPTIACSIVTGCATDIVSLAVSQSKENVDIQVNGQDRKTWLGDQPYINTNSTEIRSGDSSTDKIRPSYWLASARTAVISTADAMLKQSGPAG